MLLDEVALERITARVVERLFSRLEEPSVEIEASGRHAHLSREAVETLFGKGYSLTRASDLSQPGQFACRERIKIAGPKGEFSSVIILGPERRETQVEVSKTDAVALGLKAPVRLSGNIADTPGIRLIGPAGELSLGSGVIVAQRHIHMTPQDAERYGLTDGQVVSIVIPGERGATFHNFTLRVSPDFKTFAHIDYDEANACGFSKGMRGIIKI